MSTNKTESIKNDQRRLDQVQKPRTDLINLLVNQHVPESADHL